MNHFKTAKELGLILQQKSSFLPEESE